ncbi:MAG: hypothetical protein RI883_1440 [Bacteroidota bacterium]|jgi:hypothetical protein
MRILFLVFIILNSAIGFTQSAEFFVKKPIFKFPKTNEGIVLEHVFSVTNKGKAPLLISDYEVECSCTKAFFSTEPILPGETTEIKITFETEGKYNLQDRIIYFKTNTKKKTEKLSIIVKVKPRV